MSVNLENGEKKFIVAVRSHWLDSQRIERVCPTGVRVDLSGYCSRESQPNSLRSSGVICRSISLSPLRNSLGLGAGWLGRAADCAA